jgi:hypothetical protein
MRKKISGGILILISESIAADTAYREDARRRRVRCGVILLCALCALLMAFAPVARAFFHLEASYNEGWNVYNAATVATGHLLYRDHYGWTAVNYPMLSFAMTAGLARWTHEVLFTARMLSLAGLFASCLLMSAIVRRLGGTRFAAAFSGLFCLAMFCSAADYPSYVGVDDPQLLAQAFFLAGLYAYLRMRRGWAGLAVAALLFVVGGSIKHNLIDFPLAVLLDLLLVSRRRAAVFAACGAAFAALSVWMNLHWGGPFFVADLLSARNYSLGKSLLLTGVNLGPLVFPLGLAFWMAWRVRRDRSRRIVTLWLGCALSLGFYFIGGDGVSINALYSALLAMSVLVGLLFSALPQALVWREAAVAGMLFAWLLIPWLVVPPLCEGRPALAVWNPVRTLHQFAADEKQFDAEVAWLRAEPGPSLCESLLRCADAGKPYLYDPFNATRFIEGGKLDPERMTAAIRHHQFSAIQLNGPVNSEDRSSHFAPAILEAIREEYRPVLIHADDVIYAPVASVATNAEFALAKSHCRMRSTSSAGRTDDAARAMWSCATGLTAAP